MKQVEGEQVEQKSKDRNKWSHNKQQSLDRKNCLCFYQSAEGEHY